MDGIMWMASGHLCLEAGVREDGGRGGGFVWPVRSAQDENQVNRLHH